MFCDIHCHILYGTDDGPSTKADMLRMLERSYNDGVRDLCATPHFNFDFYGNNTKEAEYAFSELLIAVKSKYPDMTLYQGNEIFYHDACTDYLKSGICRSINSGKYVLVDFSSSEDKFAILSAMKKLISYGYLPILAHAERYRSFGFSVSTIRALKDMGILIQINAPSVIGKNGIRQMHIARRAIAEGLCDLIATDSHNTSDRCSCMTEAASYIEKRYGSAVCRKLTHTTPKMILKNQRTK